MEEKFSEIMDVIEEVSDLIYTYKSKPRSYGTDMQLYMAEVHLLNLIGINENINIKDLSKITNRTKGATSQIVNKLVNKELIIKEKDPENFRQIKLRLSDEGRKVFDYHKELDKKNYGEYLKKLKKYNKEDLNDFKEMLEIIVKITKKLQQ